MKNVDSDLFKVSYGNVNRGINNLIMAWAIDKLTGRPRYVLELDAAPVSYTHLDVYKRQG